MRPASTYPPAFVPLTEGQRERAYAFLDGLLGRDWGDDERAQTVRDLALLAGHPNHPLARKLAVMPGSEPDRSAYQEHWSRILAEGRTIYGPEGTTE